MKRSSLIIISTSFCLSLTLSSCDHGDYADSREKRVADSIEAVRLFRMADSLQKADSANTTTTPMGEEFEMLPKEIPFDLFKKRLIALDTPFVADSALVRLFPGNYYPGEETMVVWTSDATRQKNNWGWFEDDLEYFPIVEQPTETRVGTEVDFTDDNGVRNLIISFSSFAFTGDLIRCGRFACAHLALAHFKMEKNKWVLKAFDPAIGCYGAFGGMPPLKPLKFGKNNYGVWLENANGGAGGPYYGDAYVFGIVNGKFELILRHIGISRSNAPSDWDSEFSVVQDANQFGTLRCTIKGDYQTYAHFKAYEDDTSNVPMAIKDYIRTHEHFKFTIVTDFEFENGMYEFKDEDASIGEMKPDEWAKLPN